MAHSNHTNRVVVLIDMDCFYCQVEEKLDPKLEGKSIAVVQYNAWRGGGIIAVNYPARDKGVTRHMRGNEAKEKCPEIILCRVPQIRGKADLTKYREAGKRVADVLQTFTTLLERASVDEAYLDITDVVNRKIEENFVPDPGQMQNTHVVGFDNVREFIQTIQQNRDFNASNFKLAIGGFIVEEIRAEVLKRTGYKCSAGIAHNKVLAKLVCGLHKPNQQTILPHAAVPTLYENLPIRKIRSLGGKFGEQLGEDLGISTMGELTKFTEKELLKKFDDKTAIWLYNIARGIDIEPVTTKLISKSIGCCKKFPGKTALTSQEDIDHWLNELASEISERLKQDLEENNRKAKQMVVSFVNEINRKDVSGSRTHYLNSYEHTKILQNAIDVVKKNCMRSDGTYAVKFLGISTGHFKDLKNVREITSFFKNMGRKSLENEVKAKTSTSRNNYDVEINCAKQSDENDSDNSISSSIYSKTTEEDQSEYQNLVYYDEVFGNGQVCLNESNNSVDSISQELADDNSSESIILKNKIPDSFFAKYFDENSVESSTNRDFNTSKVFDEETNMDAFSEENEDISVQEITSNLLKKSDGITPNCVENSDGFKQTCNQCNKQISVDEFQSHMDYHYAIKMVKEEAHLYKPIMQNNNFDNKQKKSQSSPKANSNNKRKSSEPPAILTFFSNKTDDCNENSQVCGECGRRLSIEDMPSHIDYHVAKKLHLEINSSSVSTGKTGKLEGSSNSKHSKKIAPANKFKSINSFFKPL